MSNTKGMIFLDSENQILKEVMTKKIGAGSKRPADPTDLRLCDFDDVEYNLTIEDDTLQLSMRYSPYKELERFGAKKWIQDNYPNVVSIVAVKSSFDLTLQVSLNQVTPDSAAPVILNLANLKRNVLGAPLDQCFSALKAGTSASLSPIQLPYRPNENIYVQPQADRIVMVYSICFDDKTDQAIARTFLQEFAEAGRRVNNAPPINFSREPPLELRQVAGLKTTSNHVGYLSLAVFPSHVDNDKNREKAVTMLQGLRNYLHYHIKTTKSYLHSRMRKRVDLLLNVLNRAHPEKDPSKFNKKTMSGKTFTRT